MDDNVYETNRSLTEDKPKVEVYFPNQFATLALCQKYIFTDRKRSLFSEASVCL